MLSMNIEKLKAAAEDAGPVGPLNEGWYKMAIAKATNEKASTGAMMLVLVALVKVEGLKGKVRRHFRLVYLNANGTPNPIGAKVTAQIAEATNAIDEDGGIDERLMVSTDKDVRPFYGYIGVQPGSDGFGAKNDLREVRFNEPATDEYEHGE